MLHCRGYELAHVVFAEFLEDVDLATGEQGGDDLEGGVLGGGADEGDGAALDGAEQGVLLGLVEAVDFVDEEYGAFFLLCGVNHFAHLLDAAADGGECVEGAVEGVGDDHCQGGLADARGTPENHAGDVAAVNQCAKNSTLSDKVLLSDVFVEALGP